MPKKVYLYHITCIFKTSFQKGKQTKKGVISDIKTRGDATSTKIITSKSTQKKESTKIHSYIIQKEATTIVLLNHANQPD